MVVDVRHAPRLASSDEVHVWGPDAVDRIREALHGQATSTERPAASEMSRPYGLDELGRMRAAILGLRRAQSPPRCAHDVALLDNRVEHELRTMMLAGVDVEAVERWAAREAAE